MTGTADPVTNLSVVTYDGAPVRLSHSAATFNYPGGLGERSGPHSGTRPPGRWPGPTRSATVRWQRSSRCAKSVSTEEGLAIVQTWRITGEGVMPITAAAIDVSAILERQVAPVFSYAAFATDPGCAALDWQGNAYTDSYNSAVGHTPDVPLFGGNVGTQRQPYADGQRRDQRHAVHAPKRSRLVRRRKRADRVTHEGRRHGRVASAGRLPDARAARQSVDGDGPQRRHPDPQSTASGLRRHRRWPRLQRPAPASGRRGPAIRPPSTTSTASP